VSNQHLFSQNVSLAINKLFKFITNIFKCPQYVDLVHRKAGFDKSCISLSIGYYSCLKQVSVRWHCINSIICLCYLYTIKFYSKTIGLTPPIKFRSCLFSISIQNYLQRTSLKVKKSKFFTIAPHFVVLYR
jgi:hypothetical protein